MTLFPSISPAGKLIVGSVVVPPAWTVKVPCALRYPLAEAMIRYVPGGTVKLKVPLVLAGMVITGVLSRLLTVIVTGLLAKTCPFRVPAGRAVGVGDMTGVKVNTGVGDGPGVAVNSVVGEATAVETSVEVAVGNCDSHAYVPTICPKTADSAA